MAGRHFMAATLVAVIAGLACSESESDVETVTGIWGGEGIQLVVEGTVTSIQLTCADGHLEGLIQLDDDGGFKRTGTIAVGPVFREVEAARFEGSVSGDTLTLTIEVLSSDTLLGPFTAIRGRDVQLIQCR